MKKGNKNRRNTPKKINYSSDNQLMTLFKIIIILVVILGAFYGITLWRTTDKTKTDKKTVQTVTLPVTNKVIVIDAGHGVPDERCRK